MIKERICSYELSMLLKEKGFRERCRYCYGTAVRHNGEDIDEDEEFELKSEGRADEIEYIKGGTLHNLYYDNDKSFGKDVCATPTHQMACDWLYVKYGIFITTDVYLDELDGSKYITWKIYVCTDDVKCIQGRNDKITDIHSAFELALKYSLENLV